jgi:hypothetical protein
MGNLKAVGEPPTEPPGATYKSVAKIANLGPLEARSSVDILTNDELPATIADLKASSNTGK